MSRMTICERTAARSVVLVGSIACGALTFGCASAHRADKRPVVVPNELIQPVMVAVAPAINQSGSADFDPARFADFMASELSYADGVSAIPVSRVLAVLSAEGRSQVESPAHALEVARSVGAEAILVFAVTEYDPYDPPRIGVSAQLYGAGVRPGLGSLDPVRLSRMGRLASSAGAGRQGDRRLLAQAQRVFDASHEAVAADIQAYAARRGANDSPFGWRRYVVSQQGFMQYCCYATIEALLSGPPSGPSG